MANQVKVPQTFKPSPNKSTRANQLARFKEMRKQSGLNFTQKKLLDKYIKSINNYKAPLTRDERITRFNETTGKAGVDLPSGKSNTTKPLDTKSKETPPKPKPKGKGGSTTAEQRRKAIEGAGYDLSKKKKKPLEITVTAKPRTKRNNREFGAMTPYINAKFNRRK
jgi:hypothetical protein